MDKAKIYSGFGLSFIALAVLTTLGIGILRASRYSSIELFLAIIISVVLSPLFFIGALFLWRAEKIKMPLRRSFWGIFVIVYLAYFVFYFVTSLVLHHT